MICSILWKHASIMFIELMIITLSALAMGIIIGKIIYEDEK
jgi:hypothetical protein